MTTIVAPTGLTATVENGNSVRLNWTDNATNEQNYLIERKVSGGEWALLSVVGANVVTYLDSTVIADTGYYYRVRGSLTESNVYIYIDKFNVSSSSSEGITISRISPGVYGSHLFVVETLINKISKYLRTSPYGIVTAWGTNGYIGGTGVGNGQFDTPRGIADNGTHLFIADSVNNRIKKHLSSDGSYVAQLGGFTRPAGIAIDATNVYIADRDSHNIKVCPLSLALITGSFGSLGSGNSQFNEPYGIAVDANYIYVCDKNNNRVQIFNIASPFAYVGQFGLLNVEGKSTGQTNSFLSTSTTGSYTAASSDKGRLVTPQMITVYNGKIYVTDRGNDRIQIFQTAPPYTYLGQTGTAGTGNGQFGNIWAIDVMSNRIFVTDNDNNRITILQNEV